MKLLAAFTLAGLGLAAAGFAAHAAPRQGHAYSAGNAGPRTYVASPEYGSEYYGNVPVGQPMGYGANSCYGGRQQVRQDNRLVWVPDVTCPYSGGY